MDSKLTVAASKVADAAIVWFIASIVFGVGTWLGALPSSMFMPGADGSFGFALGMIPYLVIGFLAYIGASIHCLHSAYVTPVPFEQKMKSHVRRFFVFGLVAGAGWTAFGYGVYRTYFVH